jgi:hypothetical protein
VRCASVVSLRMAIKFFLVSRFCAGMIAARGVALCGHVAKQGRNRK